VAAGAQWIANFLITISFPAMSSWSLPLTYGMYAAFAALSFFYVLFRIPETKGMDIEQTETLFLRKDAQSAR
ncbi:MAG: transporter, partial [Agromyces sp.]|nr:transporter [Agromyces sp.]